MDALKVKKNKPGFIGEVKVAGRKAGTPNKDTQDLQAICQRLGVNIFEGLINLAINGESEQTRLKAHCEAAKYLFPQRKAIEMSGAIDVNREEKMKEVEALKAKLMECK